MKTIRRRWMNSILRARLRRWWYLLTVGMWRGECAVTYYENGRVTIVGSGIPTNFEDVFKNYRIWWERRKPGPPPPMHPNCRCMVVPLNEDKES